MKTNTLPRSKRKVSARLPDLFSRAHEATLICCPAVRLVIDRGQFSRATAVAIAELEGLKTGVGHDGA